MLGDLRSLLDTVEPGVDVLPKLVDALKEFLGAEKSLAYGVDVGPARYFASFMHVSGLDISTATAHEHMDAFLGSIRDPWGYFNPACPEPAQRNQVIHLHALDRQVYSPAPPDASSELWKRLGIPEEEQARVLTRVRTGLGQLLQRFKMENVAHLRVLVCEGPALLGWVGAMRTEPFAESEARLLKELVPSLQRRLLLDTRLREAGLVRSALEETLEALGQPAYVLTAAGRVVHANTAGRALLDKDGSETAELLMKRVRGEPSNESLSLSPLRIPGLVPHYLLIDRSGSAHVFARAQALGPAWGLTKRETEVLEHLVRGQSNKAIAVHLGCAERTVEVHVTRVLAKAQVESRSALIAKVFLSS